MQNTYTSEEIVTPNKFTNINKYPKNIAHKKRQKNNQKRSQIVSGEEIAVDHTSMLIML